MEVLVERAKAQDHLNIVAEGSLDLTDGVLDTLVGRRGDLLGKMEGLVVLGFLEDTMLGELLPQVFVGRE